METTSPELAKKLQALGLPESNNLWWCCHRLINNDDTRRYTGFIYQSNLYLYKIEWKISLYTLDEILEMLPGVLNDKSKFWKLCLDKGCNSSTGKDGYVFYYGGVTTDDLKEFINESAAQAAGQLLAWCVENGYVQINNNGTV